MSVLDWILTSADGSFNARQRFRAMLEKIRMPVKKKRSRRGGAAVAGSGLRFKEALTNIELEASTEGGTVRHETLAKILDVASSAVSGWFAGKQIPRDKYIEALADFYANHDERRRQRYRSELYKAAGRSQKAAEELAGQQDLLNLAQKARVRIGLVEYSKFTDFFRALLDAFAKFDGFQTDIVQEEYAHLPERIQLKTIGIAAPILATAKRALKFHFIETPMHVGVNAVTFRGAVERAGNLNFDPEAKSIRPIINELEVGGGFVLNTLGFKNPWDVELCATYDPETYATTLFEHWKRWENARLAGNPQPIPIVFAEELICLQVHLNWLRHVGKERMQAGREKILRSDDPALPVLLLGEASPTIASFAPFDQSHKFSYRICISVDRAEEKWLQYIKEAWRFFLHGNIQFIADQYYDLLTKLLRDVGEIKAAAPHSALDRTWTGLIEKWLRVDDSEWPDEIMHTANNYSRMRRPSRPMLFCDEAAWSEIVWRTRERYLANKAPAKS